MPADTGLMLDHFAWTSFDEDFGESFDNPPFAFTVKPVSKQEFFSDFVGDYRTIESAEAALAFLIEQGMVEVDGDVLTVPDRFVPSDFAAA